MGIGSRSSTGAGVNPVKLTLSNGEHDEFELERCNQGVVLDFSISGLVDVIDVASGEVVAMQHGQNWMYGRSGHYKQLFIQVIEEDYFVQMQNIIGKIPQEQLDRILHAIDQEKPEL